MFILSVVTLMVVGVLLAIMVMAVVDIAKEIIEFINDPC